MTLTSFSRSHQHFEIFKFWPQKSLVYTLSLEPNDRFGQTSYIDIVMLGWFKDFIRLWWPWPNFQGHYTIKTVKFSNFDQKNLSAPYLLNQMTDSGQTSYIVTLGWFKDSIRFWWPCPHFQGHRTIYTVKMSLVGTLIFWTNWWIWPNLHRNTILTRGRND